ncbi:FadR family transcriptional regulator [Paraburkholderia dinghuensis]|uniref:FadR family transcriptional regulator n=1 Tax=Paraburkholderia dinghuensis TaxID=2305225 RepID=A0A3N6PSS8_9BURK|nr:FadR family transcriptional regulator [Paraburkholderia dinghuensis]
MATRQSRSPVSAHADVITPVAPEAPTPLRRSALYVPKAPEIIADRIRKQIVGGALKVGELLPAESKLMEEYGVSRPTIREAFRILEAERLISVARGARGGALIHAPDPQLISAYTLLVLQAERTTVVEVFNTRRLIEPPLAREIALNGPADAAAQLQEKLDAERVSVKDILAFNTALTSFHHTIVELSGNRPLILMMAAVTSVIEKHQAMTMQLTRRRQPQEKVLAEVDVAFRSQKKLIDLIAKRDGNAAEAHWTRHMDIAHRLFVSGFEELTIHDLLTE